MTINRAIIVDCKSIKKLSIKSHFEMEKFVQILILTQNNPNFTLISNVLCHGTLAYRQKSKKQIQMSQLSIWCSPTFGYYLLFSSLIGFQKFTSCFQRISTWGVVIWVTHDENRDLCRAICWIYSILLIWRESPYNIYAYFILAKIVQPFSQPFILVDTQKESGWRVLFPNPSGRFSPTDIWHEADRWRRCTGRAGILPA